jgi:hypothetical protein
MNPDLFANFYFRDDQLENFPNRNSLSEIDDPIGTIAFKPDTINVTCQISQTQMEQVVADFVRVFGLKSVINAATSNLN